MIELTSPATLSETDAVAEVTNLSINRQAGLMEFTVTFGNASPAFTPGSLIPPINVTINTGGEWSASNNQTGTLTADQQTAAAAVVAAITSIAQQIEALVTGGLLPGTVVAG